jgi:hypothetical protein
MPVAAMALTSKQAADAAAIKPGRIIIDLQKPRPTVLPALIVLTALLVKTSPHYKNTTNTGILRPTARRYTARHSIQVIGKYLEGQRYG